MPRRRLKSDAVNELSMTERETILGLLRLGWSERRIAREGGHHRATVRRIRHEAGLPAAKCTTPSEVPTDPKPATEPKVPTDSAAALLRAAAESVGTLGSVAGFGSVGTSLGVVHFAAGNPASCRIRRTVARWWPPSRAMRRSLQPRRSSPRIVSRSVMLSSFTASLLRRRLGMPGTDQLRWYTFKCPPTPGTFSTARRWYILGARRGALALVDRLPNRGRITLGADKGYDVADFIARCRDREVTPHIASTSDARRRSAIDGRTTRHPGYLVSQRKRKRVEEIFGWIKTVGALRKTRHRGRDRVDWIFTFAAAAFNLTRIRNLTGAAA